MANAPPEASPPPAPEQHHQSSTEENVDAAAAATFTTHDVVLGKGNGINSLPGNLRFRKIIVKYKPLYAATPRSMKGTVAEMVINEIACLDPPGRFLEPQADQRFRQVSRKRAIEKTCQALREKKNNIGPPLPQQQHRPQQVVSPDQQQQQDTQQQHPSSEAVGMAMEPKPDQMGNETPILPMQVDPSTAPPANNTTTGDVVKANDESNNAGSKDAVTVMENDVLYGGRGRRHFHRVANQRFLELVKMSRKEYHESRCKKAVAKRIVKEWKEQTPPGRFLQQDLKSEKWYEISESKIMEKTCQALRDMKRERGPAGVKHGISDRMVDPWDRTGQQQHMKGNMNHHQPMHGGGPMPPGQGVPHHPPPPGHHHHHPYGHPPPPPPAGTHWMGQPSMYPPPQPMMIGGSNTGGSGEGGGGQMMQPQMAPYMTLPPQPMPMATAAGMGQGPPTSAMPVVNGNFTQTTAATKQETNTSKQGEENPVESFHPIDEQPPSTVEVQPSCEHKQEVDPSKEMQVDETPLPQDGFLSVPKESQTPVETAAAEVEASIMPMETEVETTSDDKPQENDLEVAVDQTDPIAAIVPLPTEEPAPSDSAVPVPQTDTPNEVMASKETAQAKEPTSAEAPANGNSEDAVESKEDLPKIDGSKLSEAKEKSAIAEGGKPKPAEENSPSADEKATDAPQKEGPSKEDEKKEGDKKGDKRKNGELEAAALLANMFR